jgi:hypothetical protein
MRKILTLAIFAAMAVTVLSGCAVTSDKYRFQQRIDHWYSLLNSEEKSLFRDARMTELGDSLSARLAKDPKLATNYRIMQESEAITSFDPDQTAVFFREIILRELNRKNLFKFMDRLDAQGQLDFAFSYAAASTNTNGLPEAFVKRMEKLQSSDGTYRALYESFIREYRLYDYTPAEVLFFFRTVSFAEVSRMRLFDVLKFLKANNALQPFLAGKIDEAAAIVTSQEKSLITTSMQLADLKSATSLNHLDERSLLKVYYEVVMKEMDSDAVRKTIAKFQ